MTHHGAADPHSVQERQGYYPSTSRHIGTILPRLRRQVMLAVIAINDLSYHPMLCVKPNCESTVHDRNAPPRISMRLSTPRPKTNATLVVNSQ
jgi:hypothetical protein